MHGACCLGLCCFQILLARDNIACNISITCHGEYCEMHSVVWEGSTRCENMGFRAFLSPEVLALSAASAYAFYAVFG